MILWEFHVNYRERKRLFKHIFCYEYETTTEDVMIILGDAGINYWLDLSDKELKRTVIRNGYYIFLCSWKS